jgi:DNA (cytosine-5)-methyltransferase 1
MRYLSVCSGIEAATVAWHPLGWQPVAFSEIEKFPSEVLKHHYPHVPNLGDMTKFEEWKNVTNIDVLVGGTPCQSFSVAGLRKGLHDPRGGLMLTFIEIAQRHRPRWIVWENVPGVLSSNGGRDFGSFLAALGELGYGWAYRVLDAQWFGVAQRRRRVFVVGCLGDWKRAAAVLFESESVCRNPAPSRKTRKDITSTITSSLGTGDPNDITQSYALVGNTIGRKPENGGNGNGWSEEISYTLTKTDVHGVAQPIVIHGTQDPCTSDIAFAQGRNNGGENVLVQHDMAFGVGAQPDVGHCLRSGASKADKHESTTYVVNAEPVDTATGPLLKGSPSGGGHPLPAVMQLVAAFKGGQGAAAGGIGYDEHVAPTLSAADSGSNRTPALLTAMQVRRLTPVECERLQGFPDNYTNIPWRKKPESPDGPRYKALGNSMAVPVMRWIGQQIQKVEDIAESKR